MKQNTLTASALLSATAFSVNAATELTPEQAAALKPYDRVTVTGRFNAIGDAVKAVNRRADKEGAASFYVVDTSDFGNSGNWRVVADLYKADAEKAEASKNRVINGVVELPKSEAVMLEPFDTVTVQGFYRSQPEVNDAITKAANEKAPTPSTSCVRSMRTVVATSVLPLSSIKRCEETRSTES